MNSKEAISELKDQIKHLAEQKASEKGSLREDHRNVPDAPAIMYRVHSRALEITAALNFYNEIRGRAYRHNVRDGLEWAYERFFVQVSGRFAVDEAAPAASPAPGKPLVAIRRLAGGLFKR